MSKYKSILAILVAISLFLAPARVSAAGIASEEEAPPGSLAGTIESITIEVEDVDESTQETTVVVVLAGAQGETETVRLSVEKATELGLVVMETRIEASFVPDPLMAGQPVQIDPLTVLVDEGLAPPPPDVPIAGLLQSVETLVDEQTGESTLLVTLLVTTPDGDAPTGFEISFETGAGLLLGSIESETVEELVVVEEMIGQPLELAPEDVLPEDEDSNPVGDLLGDFFASLFGLEPGLVADYHAQGMGYGVIAQAGILAYAMQGDSSMMQTILDAKQSGDYSAILLPDGTTVENWGQLRKAVMKQENTIKNLGQIISGHAQDAGDADEGQAEDTEDPDQKKPHGKPEDKKNNGHRR